MAFETALHWQLIVFVMRKSKALNIHPLLQTMHTNLHWHIFLWVAWINLKLAALALCHCTTSLSVFIHLHSMMRICLSLLIYQPFCGIATRLIRTFSPYLRAGWHSSNHHFSRIVVHYNMNAFFALSQINRKLLRVFIPFFISFDGIFFLLVFCNVKSLDTGFASRLVHTVKFNIQCNCIRSWREKKYKKKNSFTRLMRLLCYSQASLSNGFCGNAE